jgi:hypothetical protein
MSRITRIEKLEAAAGDGGLLFIWCDYGITTAEAIAQHEAQYGPIPEAGEVVVIGWATGE